MMTIRMNAAPRRLLAASALAGLIALAAVPGAMAQWLPPWRVFASPGDIAGRLEAQGYVLIAPLHRRPGVYLADVRAGPAGYERLVIDDRNGEILERFRAPPRSFGGGFSARDGGFAEPMPPGAFPAPPGGGFSGEPDGGPAPRSAYGGPTNLHIPNAISPYGPERAPVSTKPKPQSAPTARKTPSPMVAPPLPPPAPREAVKPEESAPPTPAPKIESPPGESENASAASAPAAPEAKPAAPGSSAEARDKSKVSIVPPALFE
jgi:hypothetical protein